MMIQTTMVMRLQMMMMMQMMMQMMMMMMNRSAMQSPRRPTPNTIAQSKLCSQPKPGEFCTI